MNKFIAFATFITTLLIYMLAKTAAVESISTTHVIEMIEPASIYGNEMIVASCDDGTILCYDYRGDKKWETTLSNLPNIEISCTDIDNNGSDEVIAVNSEGAVYCLNHNGEIEWIYNDNNTPLISICTIKIEGLPYVVCCGENQELHYLSASGKRLGSISVLHEQPYALSNTLLKSIKLPSGNEVIAMLCEQGEVATTNPILHLFQPLAKSPYKSITLPKHCTIASATISYSNKRKPSLLLGAYAEQHKLAITRVDIESGEMTTLKMALTPEAQQQVARALPTVKYEELPNNELFILSDSMLFLSEHDGYDAINSPQQFNDLFYNANNNKMVLANTSPLSGKSYIDIVNLNKRNWKKRVTTHITSHLPR